MPAYNGKFQTFDEHGAASEPAQCRLSFEDGVCTIAPLSGPPLTFDLGDVDRTIPGEWELDLVLHGGRPIRLRHFGPAFSRMTEELLQAWRDRSVQCLLLEDLEEVCRYHAVAARAEGPALESEVRLYKSNLAVLPLSGVPYQLRLAEVDAISFDEETYTVWLRSGTGRVAIRKLAKKTEEFWENLAETLDALRRASATALHDAFAFLPPGQLQALTGLMREGRSVPLSALDEIHPRLADALIAQAVGPRLRPYFDALKARSMGGALMAGFKFIRPDEDAGPEPVPEGEQDAGIAAPDAADGNTGENPLFFWFFFPLARDGRYSGIVAWEATTGSGRATYFFRAAEPVEESVAVLTRGLAQVNFRREPVYLSDESLERQPRFHRYAIGARKLPELRALRAAMLGRAVHSNIEEWAARVDSILAS